MPTALSLYATNTTSTTLTTAYQYVSQSGATSSNHTSVALKNATAFGEYWVQGRTTAWPQAAGMSAPSGHGLLFDSTALEGQTFPAGNWTPHIRISNSVDALTADITARVYVRSSAGVYTAIGQSTLTSATFSTTYVSFALPAFTTTTASAFNVGDKLYLDYWLNIKTTSATAGSLGNLQVGDLANSSIYGAPGDALTTPGYSPTGSTYSISVVDTQSALDSAAKQANKPLVEVQSALDSALHQTQKPLNDTQSATDALSHVWNAHMTLLEAISASENVQKAFNRSLFEQLSALDTVSVTKAAAGVQYRQVVSEVMSATDLLSLVGITKLLGDAYSAQDSLQKGVIRPWYDTSSATDTLTKQLSHLLTDQFSLFESHASQVARLLSETVSAVDKVSASRAMLQLLVDAFSQLDTVRETNAAATYGLLRLATALVASAFQMTIGLTTSLALGLTTTLLPASIQLALTLLASPLGETATLIPSPFSLSFSFAF